MYRNTNNTNSGFKIDHKNRFPVLKNIYTLVRKFFLSNIPKDDLADQFAFKPTGSTTAALSYIFSNITEALQTADHVRYFLIDFSKAFDTVPHVQLLTKLEALGCSPVITSWLSDYLTDRTQALATNGSCTAPLTINRGLVQGSGIGPCTFIAYISDLKPNSDATTFCKFADDLTALVRLDAEAEQEIAHIMQWSDRNKLLINLKKNQRDCCP